MKKTLSRLMALCLTFTLCAAPAAALAPADALALLQQHYVDPLPADLNSMTTVEEMLDALNDPYTVYFTAEEYERFLNSVDGEIVVGIGVSLQTIYDQGFMILSVLPDSPALEAGIQPGDKIIAVDGAALTATSDIRSAVAGEEGTQVTITVYRPSQNRELHFTMTRRTVRIPIVTYRQEGSAGFIDCSSFGATTSTVVRKALTSMDEKTAVWIMDLRSNPGGTTRSTAATAGLFHGGGEMIYLRDAAGTYTFTSTTPAYPDLTDKPLIILTSSYSASGSEMFAGDARDHGFGIAVGQRTFGKGIAQNVYNQTNTPDLFQGDALKITTYRFFSPGGTTNHIVGVIPTLLVSREHTQRIAQLMSTPKPYRAQGHLKLELENFDFYIHLSTALEEENKAAFTEFLEALPPSYSLLYEGHGKDSWHYVTPRELAADLELPYEGRGDFSDLALCGDRQADIQTLAAYGLVSGYEDGTFRPDSAITRAEFCTMMAAALNLPSGVQPVPFTDVAARSWYSRPIAAMYARGFISGYEDGSFRPDSIITGDEIVTILSSVASWATMDGYELLSQTELPLYDFLDYQIWSEYAQMPAWRLNEFGLSLDAITQPSAPATRLQAASLLFDLMHTSNLFWGNLVSPPTE